MAFAHSKEGEEPSEDALIARLRRFVEDSDLSFYKIASRVGTSGGAPQHVARGDGQAACRELAEIEKLLRRLTLSV